MQPNFKEYFYFNNSERRGVTILLTILIILLLFNFYFPYSGPEELVPNNKAESLLFQLDSMNQVEEEKKKAAYFKKKPEVLKANLKPFNPNELDKGGWQKLGLSKKQSNTILNYLEKGGNFRVKSDLKKMYSISDQKYIELEPYILLPDTLKYNYKKKVYKSKKWVPEVVNINSADSLAFIKLRGIGPTYASRIIKYRNQLGGFHSLTQLNEVYGISDSLIKTFSDQLQLDTVIIQKLDINKLEAKDLKENPYIDWNVANSIVNYRKQHGLYDNIEDVKKSVLIDDSLFQKMKPYIQIVK